MLRVVIVIVVLVALVLVETTSRSGVLWRLTTFTYQVNVLAAAYYVWTLVSPSRVDARPGLRGAVVLYVVVAGVVWNAFLTEMSMGYTTANVLLHVVMPALAMIDWLLVGRSQGGVRWWQPLAWLAYPVLYLGLALLVLNEAGRRAPYYFLDPDSVGAAAVAGNVALLALAFAALGYALSGLGRASVAIRGAASPSPVSSRA